MSSFYNRSDHPDGTVFSVTPAPYPGEAQLQLLFFGSIFTALFSLAMMVILIGLLLFPFSIFMFFAWRKLRKRFKEENARRVPQDIHVSADGIRASGRQFRASDIAELMVTHSMAGPERVHYERVDNTAKALGATLRENTQNAQHFVCYEASVRLRSDSRPNIVVGGLTHQTAEALVRDIRDALAATPRAVA
jgi:hypothetical protein